VDVVPVFPRMTGVYLFGCVEIITIKCNFCGDIHFAPVIYSYGFVAYVLGKYLLVVEK
jgi:hypothetical protein